MILKFFFFHALIVLIVADVSHLNNGYLPPFVENQEILLNDKRSEPQTQQQQQVQHVEVLRDEAADGNVHAITEVPQSLENENVLHATTKQSPSGGDAASVTSGDPFYQPGFAGVGAFPVAGFPQQTFLGFGRPPFPGQGFPIPNVYGPGYAGQFPGQGFSGQVFPGQGFPGQGFPGQGFPGQGFLGQGFPIQGFPGQGFPVQGFPGQGIPGQSFPGQGFAVQGFPGQGFSGQGLLGQVFPPQAGGFPPQAGGFPPQVGGFPGVPFSLTQQPSESSPSSDADNRDQQIRIASDTVYGANGGYVYEKPK